MRIVVVAAVISTALAAAGLALARTPSQQGLIDSTVRFLQESQRSSGGFAPPGGQPSQGISAWVALALASAGINPQDQARCGTDAYSFLVDHFREGFEEEIPWPQIATTAFERELLVVDAAGTDPHDFAGFDLVEEITDRQLADGSFPYEPGGRGEANDTIFAILALSPLHEAKAEGDIQEAAEWLVAEQDEDGGWYYSGKTATSEVDITGAAIEALVAAGPPPGEVQRERYEAAEQNGLEYLHRSQLPDGGFPARPAQERESNVASTAWAVQAIWASGGNPETWTVGPEGREPLDYMESMQQEDGHIRWRASSDLNGIWMTAYVTPAFAGQALPVPTAPRYNAGASDGDAANCLEAGQGGESPRSGEGVLAGGGGGRGAPLFSRPKPQSKGRTPGGARIVRNRNRHPVDHSRDRRGANTKQPRGTESTEARSPHRAKRKAGRSAAPADDGGSSTGAAALAQTGAGGGAGEEVSGLLVGDSRAGRLAFGAPGLHSAEAGRAPSSWLAIAIAAAALLVALIGAGLERGRHFHRIATKTTTAPQGASS